ncbi:MAG: tRNA (guanosine(37)-N1)-methyltransferase TrmD [Anaerolineae bacterium]|jgi:tRNA (guanine37-N1)-methyltransferase|nr:tRNA (guanosine(37)-N1)-methyltransferase TrmD [Chloroflexota bacterium]
MRFDIFTLFPGLFQAVFQESIVGRALEAGLAEIHIHNIRDYAPGRHQVTDDMPYGGGGGMVLKPEPIAAALRAVLGADLLDEQRHTGQVRIPVLLMTPAGTRYTQETAADLERYGHVAILCGRYEAIDERVADLFVTHQVSLGDFVLSGGEIAAMAVVETVTRLVPGVLGDMRALVDDSFSSGLLEYPHYTRPPVFEGLAVPEVLLSGDHARVAQWRRQQSLRRTLERRPDLLVESRLSRQDRSVLGRLAGRRIVDALDSPD